jgi:predicted  nucleic acid-binding Zn-ribbon protein
LHPVVAKLFSLQKIDQKVALAQKKLDSIPRETEEREKKLKKLEGELGLLRDRCTEIEVQVASLETKVGAIETGIKKQEAYLNQASSPSEYEAARHQIRYLQRDREELQNEQLALMEEQETLNPRIAELETSVEEEKKTFQAFLTEADSLRIELEAKKKEVADERQAKADEIPGEYLARYEEIFASREGTAVVPAERRYCSGCFTKLTPNDWAMLANGTNKVLVTCRTCGRFLYDPDSEPDDHSEPDQVKAERKEPDSKVQKEAQ